MRRSAVSQAEGLRVEEPKDTGRTAGRRRPRSLSGWCTTGKPTRSGSHAGRMGRRAEREKGKEIYAGGPRPRDGVMRFQRETLESRRREHEEYLRRRLGPRRVWVRVEGREAVIDLWGAIRIRIPASRLFRNDALSRIGI